MKVVRCPHCDKKITLTVESTVMVGPAEAPQTPGKAPGERVLYILSRAGWCGRTARQLQHSIRGIKAAELNDVLCGMIEMGTIADEVRGKTRFYMLPRDRNAVDG